MKTNHENVDNKGIVDGNLISCDKCILECSHTKASSDDINLNKVIHILNKIADSVISTSNQSIYTDIISDLTSTISTEANIIKSLEQTIRRKDEYIKGLLNRLDTLPNDPN